jgi:hypothetical protein
LGDAASAGYAGISAPEALEKLAGGGVKRNPDESGLRFDMSDTQP